MVRVIDGFKNVFTNLKNLNKSYTETTSRPAIMQPYMATDTGAKLPIFPFPLIMIGELADMIDALRIPIEALNREIFKNGFEVVERFKFKCEDCGKEFKYKPSQEDADDEEPNQALQTPGGKPEGKEEPDNKTEKPDSTDDKSKPFNKADDDKEGDGESKEKPSDRDESPDQAGKFGGQFGDNQPILNKTPAVCDSCGSTNIIRPDPKNRQRLEKLIRFPVNGNKQTIQHVSRQLERDLEVYDGAYMLLLKNYWINDATGEIDPEKTQIKEIIRIDPPEVALIVDSDGRLGYDDKRNPLFVCPRFEHRDKRLTTPRCDRCGAQALKAEVEVSSVYSIGIPQPKRVVYGEGEVIWLAGKYKPGLVYGFSPIYAVWSKAMSLSHMDEYLRKYFDKMRPPRGLLVIASRNYETFRKTWKALEQRATEDPYMLHPLLVESEKGGRQLAQWINFTGTLDELQFVDVRRELREIVAAIYGVLPLYYGQLESGWANEGMQVTVTNRAIKWGQDLLCESFLVPLAREMGVDDWILKLKHGEEADKLRELQTEAQEIQNHQTLQSMGFQVSRTHQGEWKVSKSPTAPPMGGMGGFGGRGDSLTGDKDKVGSFKQGAPGNQRPSDPGGVGQGHPSPGGKRSSPFNISNKGHTADFWIKKFVKNGLTVDEATDILKTFKKEKTHNGIIYYPEE